LSSRTTGPRGLCRGCGVRQGRAWFTFLSCRSRRVQGVTRAFCVRTFRLSTRPRTPSSREIPCPSTLTEASSDLHRGCLPQLCCAFGLSQTLDALFRSRPLRPCFMPVTLLGFCLQRVSPPGSRPHFRAGLSFLPFLSASALRPPLLRGPIGALRRAAAPRIRASGRSVPAKRCYP